LATWLCTHINIRVNLRQRSGNHPWFFHLMA
jgi:hypothetical protein